MTGDRIIAAQRERVERLRAAGQNTAEAEHLLARFERSQAMFVDDLKRLQDLGVSLWQTELRTSLSTDLDQRETDVSGYVPTTCIAT